MQDVSLENKTAQAFDRLESLLEKADPARIVVAFSGGKDSTVSLDLWRRVLAAKCPGIRPRALSLDTGVKFPEALASRDRLVQAWDVDLTVARPEVEPDYPIASDAVDCCRRLKVEPLNKALKELGVEVMITGLRRDEHPSRESRQWLEDVAEPMHRRAHPLLEFTEMDVWAYILSHGLPYSELYDAGYRSLGCQPCTSAVEGSEREGRAQAKEDKLGLLHSLGYF